MTLRTYVKSKDATEKDTITIDAPEHIVEKDLRVDISDLNDRLSMENIFVL